jgi:hypothetical protein
MRQESELVQKAKQTILQRRKTSLKVNAQKLLPESPSSLAPEPPPLEKGSRKGSTNVAEELTRHVTRQRLSVLTTELKEGTLKQAASTDAMPVKVASWRRSRQEISKRITLTHLMLAFVSLIGCLCAVASHEVCIDCFTSSPCHPWLIPVCNPVTMKCLYALKDRVCSPVIWLTQ